MTSKIGSAVTGKVVSRITSPSGVNAKLAALNQAGGSLAGLIEAGQVRSQNVASEVAERSAGAQYPAMSVYCEKIVNSQTEKFRRFSGSVRMAVEIRHSQDRIENLEDLLERYADATAQILDGALGDWGDGMFYAGGYEISFSPVKHGGKNFIQTAKITFEIGVSRN